MLTEDLFRAILLQPAQEGADTLYIVSGFASAALAAGHLEELNSLKRTPAIRLIVGMFPQIANLQSEHRAFQSLSRTDYPVTFECRYVIAPPRVHVKAYSWYKGNAPYRGFIGSANYSKTGFGRYQQEAVAPCDPAQIKAYFDTLWSRALDCRDTEADRRVLVTLANKTSPPLQRELVSVINDRYVGLEKVHISLLDRNGSLPARSGLNWGQRPEYNRNPNQAYIRIPSSIARTEFFPPKKEHFTVLADDDISLICVRAQEKIAKAIQTPLDNSALGLYFRRRLGLPSGVPVRLEDLHRYGRTDVEFYKIDSETYLMDFAPKATAQKF